MFFWKDMYLAEMMRDNSLSESRKFSQFMLGYFMLYFFLNSGVENLLTDLETEFFIFLMHTFIPRLINFIIIAACFVVAYKINKKNDNKFFIERVICLMPPIIIRSYIFLSPIIVLITLFPIFIKMNPDELDKFIFKCEVQLYIFTGLYCIIRLSKCMRVASASK